MPMIEVKTAVSEQTRDQIDELVATGLYGLTRAETLRTLVLDGVREAFRIGILAYSEDSERVTDES